MPARILSSMGRPSKHLTECRSLTALYQALTSLNKHTSCSYVTPSRVVLIYVYLRRNASPVD